MKTLPIIFFMLFLLLTSINALSQWYRQYQVTPSNHLYHVKFINDKTGWTCGNIGTIIKTTNAGKVWIRQSVPVTKTLYKIFPVDSQVVYCVGFFECILKTTNGGDNWNIIRNSTEQSPTFESLFFLNRHRMAHKESIHFTNNRWL